MTHPIHHVAEDLLLSYAQGTLEDADSLVVAAHLTLCPRCRRHLAAAEALGGVLLEETPPAPLHGEAWAALLPRLDQTEAASQPAEAPEEGNGKMLYGVSLPRMIAERLPANLDRLPWQYAAPGVKHVLLLNQRGAARARLVAAKAGKRITAHGHTGHELTVVLAGGYRDGGKVYGRGDVQAVDEQTVHAPLIDADGPCLSLITISGVLRPTGWIARLFARLRPF